MQRENRIGIHIITTYVLEIKSFAVGERVIYPMPSSTQKVTRVWTGPCEIVRKNSPYSYIIEFNGKKHWCHASHLRKYNERVIQAVSFVFEVVHDFGDIATLELIEDELNTYRGLQNRHSSSSVHDDCAVSDCVIQPNLNKIPENPTKAEVYYPALGLMKINTTSDRIATE
jgi:hypothetical protein